MAFDSTVMAATVQELAERLVHGRISKVYQPLADELNLLIYAGGVNYRLQLVANARFARLQTTRIEKKNPQAPPTFCMLLRKYIDGGRILAIRQVGRERICRIHIGVTDELGNPAEYILVAEVMGKHSNIVLLNPQGRIVDAIRRVTEEVNRYRELLPGLAYIAPPPLNKLDPATLTTELLGAPTSGPAWQFILDRVDGLGPLLAKEAVARAGYDPTTPADQLDLGALVRGVQSIENDNTYEPTILTDELGRLKDFHVLPLVHWTGGKQGGYSSVSTMLEAYYGRKEDDDRFGALRGSIAKLVKDRIAFTRRKHGFQLESRLTAENSEGYRVQGELITANLWQMKKGDLQAEVVDYYDPEGSEVTIPLDPLLTPAENAQAYYHRYQKARAGKAVIEEQLAKSGAEVDYLEQVDVSLQAAASMPDLEEIRRELQAEGYLAEQKSSKKLKPGKPGKAGKPGKTVSRDEKPAPPLTITSTDGLEIWVGRNNRQNDYLTMKLAATTDLWFHTKEIPGSHVILRVPHGREVPERAMFEAAALAGWYSKGRDSASVPVDYTLKKHVRKPSGAKPGMVIYEHQKTLWVTPDPALNPILQQHLGGLADGSRSTTADERGAENL